MTNSVLNQRVSIYTVVLLPLVTLTISPWANLDSINLPKFAILVIGACLIVGTALAARPLHFIQNNNLSKVMILFLSAMVLNLFTHGFSARQFFGTYGSNFGIITFLCLAVLYMISANTFSSKNFYQLLIALATTGLINLIYGALQFLELDPIKWNNDFDNIIGTLGNPNFVSSLLGISSVACLALVTNQQRAPLRIFLISASFGMVLLALLSNSIQGVFAAGAGFLALFYCKILRGAGPFLQVIYFSSVSLIVLLTIGGIFNKGPLQEFIYGNSVVARIFYWNAAIEMAKAEPITGFGFDTYGDYYRLYRSENAASSFGPDLVANSSHNWLLDILVFGGLPLFLSFIALLFLPLRSAVRLLLKRRKIDAIGSGLISCWIASIAQSMVSTPQLGLAVWFWSLSGAVIGYELLLQDPTDTKKLLHRSIIPPLTPVLSTIGVSLGVLLVAFPVSKDIHFRRAVEFRDAKQIIMAATRWPSEVYYKNYAAELFLASELTDNSLRMAQEAAATNQNSAVAWRLIIANPKVSVNEKERALTQMERIDPYFKR